jgi:hypothetical protein
MAGINEPKPEVLRIEQLVGGVKTGDIKLPKFQRPFVWKRTDILKLLDSIYKGYPIGSILLWLTTQELASERNIADLVIDERPKEYPTKYVLDGQQRLSTLCGALYWQEGDPKSLWNIWFDLETEVFFYPKPEDDRQIHSLPLNKLLDTFDFMGELEKISLSPKKDIYKGNASNLLRAVKDYMVPVVTIGDMSIDEVSPIFERINSSGRQLTLADLMRAATWKGGFDLNETIKSVRKSLEQKNFDDIQEMAILRNVAACAGFGINNDGIEKLRNFQSDDLKQFASRAIRAFELAVDFLTSELPLPSLAYLPYGLQLNYLAEFFNLCNRPSNTQRKALKRWFWHTSFSYYFRGYNTAQMSKHLRDIRGFSRNEIELIPVGKAINLDGFILDKFFLRSASSKAFALLLAQNNPRNFLDGSLIDIRRALSVVNKLEYHHIFPRNYLHLSGVPQTQIDIQANICMLPLSGNRAISDSKPSIYFARLEESLKEDFIPILDSHYINVEALQAAFEDDYDEFINYRKEVLKEAILSLTENDEGHGNSVLIDSDPEEDLDDAYGEYNDEAYSDLEEEAFQTTLKFE